MSTPDKIMICADPPIFLVPSLQGKHLSTEDWAVVMAHSSYARLVSLIIRATQTHAAAEAASAEAWRLEKDADETRLRARRAGAHAARVLNTEPEGSTARFAVWKRAEEAWELAVTREIVESMRQPSDPVALAAAHEAEETAREQMYEARRLYEEADAREGAAREAAASAADAEEDFRLKKSEEAKERERRTAKAARKADKELGDFWKTAAVVRFFQRV